MGNALGISRHISHITRDAVCERHGAYTETGMRLSERDTWAGCLTCHNEARAARDAEQQEAMRKKRLEAYMAAAMIPARYAALGFEQWDDARYPGAGDHRRSVAGYCARATAPGYGGQNLTLLGVTGNGKSHLAAAALRSVVERGRRGLFLCAPQIERMARDNDEDRLASADTVPFLVIDELGGESGTSFVRAAMSATLSNRHNAMLPTIITSNLSPEAIFDRYGQGMASRIIEDAYVVHFAAESQRGR